MQTSALDVMYSMGIYKVLSVAKRYQFPLGVVIFISILEFSAVYHTITNRDKVVTAPEQQVKNNQERTEQILNSEKEQNRILQEILNILKNRGSITNEDNNVDIGE